MKDHDTTKLVLKEADIDDGIVPVINWLNSMDGLLTLHCCQGTKYEKDEKDEKDGAGWLPYVSFMCCGAAPLQYVLGEVKKFNSNCPNPIQQIRISSDIDLTEIDYVAPRYTIYWEDVEALEKFIKYLNSCENTRNFKSRELV